MKKLVQISLVALVGIVGTAHADIQDGTYSGTLNGTNTPCAIKFVHAPTADAGYMEFAAQASTVDGTTSALYQPDTLNDVEFQTPTADDGSSWLVMLDFDATLSPSGSQKVLEYFALGGPNSAADMCKLTSYTPFASNDPALPALEAALQAGLHPGN